MIKGRYQTKLSFGLRLAPPFPATKFNATFELQRADLTLKTVPAYKQALNYNNH
jgi:hypothetical protein